MEQSVFKIIFVKLANFNVNISEAQGDFLWSFARNVGSVGKMLQQRSTTHYDAVLEQNSMISEDQLD